MTVFKSIGFGKQIASCYPGIPWDGNAAPFEGRLVQNEREGRRLDCLQRRSYWQNDGPLWEERFVFHGLQTTSEMQAAADGPAVGRRLFSLSAVAPRGP